MNKLKISLILNATNVIIIILAIVIKVFDLNFMGEYAIEELVNVRAHQYFTFDSNVLLGISSLILVIYEILFLKNIIKLIPKWVVLLKYVSTSAVTLTMVTVIIFLAPFAPYGYFSMFLNSNLVFHLFGPLIAIISFAFFEETNSINRKEVLLGIVPSILYGFYYIPNIIIHMENGVAPYAYDWYGFSRKGVLPFIIITIVFIFATYLFSFILYYLNKKRYFKKNWGW